MKGARVPVRLKNHENPAEIARLGGTQCGADLRRVMGVVVNYGDAVMRFDLEPPFNTLEALQRCGHDIRLNHPHFANSSESAGGVKDVVHAGNLQPDLLLCAAVETQNESRTETFNMDIGDRNVGRRSRTIGHDAAFNLRYERLHRRLVQTENRRAVDRNLVAVGQESSLNILQI